MLTCQRCLKKIGLEDSVHTWIETGRCSACAELLHVEIEERDREAKREMER